MFRPSQPMMGGLLWKIPWRISAPQKARQRKRLRAVDKVVDTVSAALERQYGKTTKSIVRWKAEMPREEEMLPRDKYTMFDRKERTYRKGIHSKHWTNYSMLESQLAGPILICFFAELPKWTRVSQRINPPGF
ncbi:hypothetical protein KEM55_006534 [Ascosphaera atra]|nr:hypothetical protein KEM55_006534 [Ascosphaera atra]